MARIRTIKPEFFTSEDIVALSPMARLLYIACWCEADREGRMEWKPGTMKLRYFPGDNCDIKELAGELLGRGLVVVYEVGGREHAEIPSFTYHQVINNRETASSFPPNPARVGHASGTRQARVSGEGRKEGKGGRVVPLNGTTPQEGRRDDTGVDPADAGDGGSSPSVVLLPLLGGDAYPVVEGDVGPWQTAFPAVDVRRELLAMAAWLDANPKNRKTEAGIRRFIVAWLSKAQNRAPRVAVGGDGGASAPWVGAL